MSTPEADLSESGEVRSGLVDLPLLRRFPRAVSRVLLLLLLVPSGCAPVSSRGPAPEAVGASGPLFAPVEVIPGHEVHSRPSSVCADCHSNTDESSGMRTPGGEPAAPYDLWRGTMMANSARDPLWRAMVSAEIARRPAARAEIEASCMTCHAPAATADRRQHGGELSLADLESERLGEVARDGVTCTVCHGISARKLGTPESFTGGWEIDHSQRAFGPHDVPFPLPMRPFTGWTPTQSSHILESSLCGSCHTLYTETLDPTGHPTGTVFLEQSPYLEWRHSLFSTEREGSPGVSCQGCHLPTRDESGQEMLTRIARTPMGSDFSRLAPRSPYGRHILVGGNTLIPELLAEHGEEFGVEAPPAAFLEVARRARAQLSEKTAALSMGLLSREEGTLQLGLEIASFAGHKIPTGHPTRRMWVGVRVLDGEGRVLHESGAFDRMGRILGPGGAPLPSESAGGPVVPWSPVIRSEADAPIFEMVMADEDGSPTWSLLSAAAMAKDTRILPPGWDVKGARRAGLHPVGVSVDEAFEGGRVLLSTQIPLGSAARAELRVEATLHYQTLGARFQAELARVSTPEMDRFQELLAQRGNPPEIVDRVELLLPPIGGD